MSFPAYPETKSSGLEWLGAVPAHWNVQRLRYIASINPSKNEVAHLDRATGVSFVPMEAIGDDGTLSLDLVRPIGDVENGYTYFREGDVTVAKITPCFENGKGAIMRRLAEGIGFGTTELIVVRPKVNRTTSEYLHWLFNSTAFRRLGEGSMYGAGGQKRVPDDFVRNFTTAIPPIEEQEIIASFLDRETSKIDALIDEQKRLMDLLKEKRQAVISHAVTKGLNPDAPMKDSGIEWLGMVPAHWDVCALRHRYEVLLGKMLDEKRVSGKYLGPYLRNVDVRWGKVNIEDLPTMDFQPEEVDRYALKAGDLLVCEGGEVGRSAVWRGELPTCFYQKALHRLRPHYDTDDTEYMFYVMWAAASSGLFAGPEGKATIVHLPAETLRRHRFAFPPASEQRSILDHLRYHTDEIESSIRTAVTACDLLQERRKALISAAVTGQIDVRGLVPMDFSDEAAA